MLEVFGLIDEYISFSIEKSMITQLVRSSAGAVIVRFFHITIQFVTSLILARMLGPAPLGVYSFVIAFVNIVSALTQCGLPSFLIRTVSISITDENKYKLQKLFDSAVVSVAIISLIVITFIILTIYFFDIKNRIAFTIGLIAVPFLATNAATAGMIRGAGFVVYSQFSEIVAFPLFLLLILAPIYIFDFSMSVEVVLFATVASSMIAFFTSKFRLRQYIGGKFAWCSISDLLSVLNKGLPFLFLASAQVLNYQIDLLMLGFLTTQQDVGFYRVAVQTANILGVVIYAISATISSRISLFHVQNNLKELQKLLIYSHRIGTFATLLPAGIIIFFNMKIIILLFGVEYISAAQPLIILALAKIIYSTVGLSGIVISMLNLPLVAAFLTVLMILFNIILDFILIPLYGIKGAAISAGVSQVITAMAGVFYLSIKEKVGISFFHSVR